ncbi:MAG: hypothetical protein HY454_00520 [Parcubacteria group bacterium]|nr:hypothetical protein [Parcubacteria group bacterium]
METISLIPKSEKERGLPRFVSFQKPKLELNRAAKVELILVLALAGLWGGAYFWQGQLRNTLAVVNTQLQAVIGQRDMSLENRLKTVGAVLETFGNVLNEHRYWSKVFEMLEKNTLPEVTFVSFEGDDVANAITLKGRSPSYAVLARQVKVLQTAPDVSAVTTSGINLSPDGSLNFSVKIGFSRSLLFVEK